MFETKIIISPKHANYDSNMSNENKNILPRTLLLKLTGKTLKSNCIACPLMASSLTMIFWQTRIELSTPRTATDIALCVVALLEWGTEEDRLTLDYRKWKCSKNYWREITLGIRP